MIYNIESQPAAQCFAEINEAVKQLRGQDDVVFNMHTGPHDAEWNPRFVYYNFENVGVQVDPRQWWNGTTYQELWDFSARNVERYPLLCHVRHVPVGYHPSMERFTPRPYAERDVDIAFTGHPNERRNYVIDKLLEKGLRVVQLGHGCYGADRDRLLARSKLVLNMLYYDNGTFPALRVAHLVANRVPVLSEVCSESWEFVPSCAYGDLVRRAYEMVTRRREYLDHLAESTYLSFRMQPLQLPSR